MFISISCFSQSKRVNNDVEKLDTIDYRWESRLKELINNPPSYYINSNLKLLSYERVPDTDMNVRDFLSMPIDGNQLFPKASFTEEALREKSKENYEVESILLMVPFADMTPEEQYMKIGMKFFAISELIFKDKPASLLKLQWKYRDKEFFAYCVVSENKFVYDYILSNAAVMRSGMRTN